MTDSHPALRQLAIADQQWEAALDASDFAPPDDGFAERIRDISRAAKREADALAALDGPGVNWNPAPGSSEMTLSWETRPGGNRPGPRELWDEFDRCVRALGTAMEGATMLDVSRAFGDLAGIAATIATELQNPSGAARRRAV